MLSLPRRAGVRISALAAAAALTVVTTAEAATRCASPSEISAVQVSAVQQELTDAALACGPAAVANFNRFQTRFRAELRRSDAVLLALFKRLNGARDGNAAYDSYKTRAISHAEQRRTKPGAHDNFCATADIVFEAALAPDKPVLEDFVSGVPVYEQNPVDACEIKVAITFQGVQAGSAIAPTPRPDLPGDSAALIPASNDLRGGAAVPPRF